MKNKTLIIWCLILASCLNKKTAKENYTDYITNPAHGILKQIKVNNTDITVQYIPGAYNLILAKRNGEEADSTAYKSNLYFKITLSNKDFTPDVKAVEYLSFSMQQDFYLTSGNLTRYPLICQKIENGRTGQAEYMLVFAAGENAEKTLGDFELVYTDKIFGTGQQQFRFSGTDIRKIPPVKLNQG